MKRFAPALPPHSTEAEQAVLGGLLLDPRYFDDVVARVSKDDFYRREHQLIFEGIGELVIASSDLLWDDACYGSLGNVGP